MHEELKLYVERRWRHIKRKKDRGIFKRVWRKGKRTGADGKETMECELVDRWNSRGG
jgi:hypothetical protein